MTRKLSVTAACNAANQRVGKPAKFGPNSWQVFFHEPDETASCAMQTDDYFKAACYARELKAITAMELLAGAHGYRAEYELTGFDTLLIDEINQKTPWRVAVRDVHRAMVSK